MSDLYRSPTVVINLVSICKDLCILFHAVCLLLWVFGPLVVACQCPHYTTISITLNKHNSLGYKHRKHFFFSLLPGNLLCSFPYSLGEILDSLHNICWVFRDNKSYRHFHSRKILILVIKLPFAAEPSLFPPPAQAFFKLETYWE